MPLFNVEASAIYNVTVEVQADSKAEALRLVKDHTFEVVDETFNRWHPDTEFSVELDTGELGCILTRCGEPFFAVHGGLALCIGHYDDVRDT